VEALIARVPDRVLPPWCMEVYSDAVSIHVLPWSFWSFGYQTPFFHPGEMCCDYRDGLVFKAHRLL